MEGFQNSPTHMNCTSLGIMLHSVSSHKSVLCNAPLCSVLAHGGMYVTEEHAAFLVPSGVIALCVGPWAALC